MKTVTITTTDEVFDIDWNGLRYTLFITENKTWITITKGEYDIHLSVEQAIQICNGILTMISNMEGEDALIDTLLENLK